MIYVLVFIVVVIFLVTATIIIILSLNAENTIEYQNLGRSGELRVITEPSGIVKEIPRTLDIGDDYISRHIENLFDIQDKKIQSIRDKVIIEDGEHKTAIITTYHHQNPKKDTEYIRSTHEDINFLILDGEPKQLCDINTRDNDIIITTKKNPLLLPKHGTKVYLPYYVYHLLFKQKIPLEILTKKVIPPKTDFCFFAYSNCDERFEGVVNRKNFYYLMQKMSGNRVKNYGKCYGGKSVNHNSGFCSNKETLKNFKFCIAFENEAIEGYITEKMTNPMIAGAIPIYLGAPDVDKHFNPKSFIHVRDFNSFEDCINYVLKVDSDPELYNSIINEPWFVDNEVNEYIKEVSTKGSSFYQNLQEYISKISPLLFMSRLTKDFDTVLLTFSDTKIYKFDRIVLEAQNSLYFDKIYAYGPKNLDPVFLEKHQDFINQNKRGYGYYIWKPQVIFQTLETLKEGDILIWADSGCTIQGGNSRKLNEYIEKLRSPQGTMIGFKIHHQTRKWTKQRVIDYFKDIIDEDNMDKFLEEEQTTTSFIMMKKCDKTIKFVREWRDICENYEIINDDITEDDTKNLYFCENRHEQSVYDILIKHYGFERSSDNYSDSNDDFFYEDGTRRIVCPTRKK